MTGRTTRKKRSKQFGPPCAETSLQYLETGLKERKPRGIVYLGVALPEVETRRGHRLVDKELSFALSPVLTASLPPGTWWGHVAQT